MLWTILMLPGYTKNKIRIFLGILLLLIPSPGRAHVPASPVTNMESQILQEFQLYVHTQAWVRGDLVREGGRNRDEETRTRIGADLTKRMARRWDCQIRLYLNLSGTTSKCLIGKGQVRYLIEPDPQGSWLNQIATNLHTQNIDFFLHPGMISEKTYGRYWQHPRSIELAFPPLPNTPLEFLSHEFFHARVSQARSQGIPHLFGGYLYGSLPSSPATEFYEDFLDFSEIGAYLLTLRTELAAAKHPEVNPKILSLQISRHIEMIRKISQKLHYHLGEAVDYPAQRMEISLNGDEPSFRLTVSFAEGPGLTIHQLIWPGEVAALDALIKENLPRQLPVRLKFLSQGVITQVRHRLSALWGHYAQIDRGLEVLQEAWKEQGLLGLERELRKMENLVLKLNGEWLHDLGIPVESPAWDLNTPFFSEDGPPRDCVRILTSSV